MRRMGRIGLALLLGLAVLFGAVLLFQRQIGPALYAVAMVKPRLLRAAPWAAGGVFTVIALLLWWCRQRLALGLGRGRISAA
jgi:hypothetical protein